MANSNSTRNKEQPNSIINPTGINPLIAYANQPEETAESVRNVLAFMGFAFRNGITLDDTRAAYDGAGRILATCAAALSFHIDQKGVAA